MDTLCLALTGLSVLGVVYIIFLWAKVSALKMDLQSSMVREDYLSKESKKFAEALQREERNRLWYQTRNRVLNRALAESLDVALEQHTKIARVLEQN